MPARLLSKNRLLTLLTVLIPCLGLAQSGPLAAGRVVASVPAPQLPATPPTIAGQLLLRLRPQFQPASGAPNAPLVPALAAALQALHASNLRQKFPHSLAPDPRRPGGPDLRLLYQFTVPPGTVLAKARAMLLSTGAVEYVEPLYVRQAQVQPNDPLADSTAASTQYYLKTIHAYRAWDIYQGDSTIVIGLTDGGARLTHEDLRRQIKRNYADPVDGIDNDHDGYVDNFQGWDLANNDNDPGFDANEARNAILHGSQVAGILAGEHDNGKGIAGVGFKCRFLPLSIYPTTPTGIFAGYEAIQYAADHGCKVVNMSWGAPGGYSRFEQDVINYAAITRDVVLVAAAGNTLSDPPYYPASYEHVISVSGVNNRDQATGFTYNRRVDLTAPADALLTTRGDQRATSAGPVDADYEFTNSGTSYAAPQVAATAALIRGRFPQYTAAQVAAQLRQTTDNIDAVPGNDAFAGRLGTGRLNMVRALTATDRREARVVKSRFEPAGPSFAPGEQIRLSAQVLNLLNPLRDVHVTLTSLSPYLTIDQGEFVAGSLAVLDSAANRAAPFQLRVATQNVPLNSVATLRYHVAAADGYQSVDYLDVQLYPDYVTLDAGNLTLTLTSRGNLGYDDARALFGRGAVYKQAAPLLSEGGLLLATSATRVSDRLRGVPVSTTRQSFFSLSQARRLLNTPSSGLAEQEARVLFQDSLPALDRNLSLGVRVRLRGLSWASAPRRDFIILEYTLKNIGPDPLNPLLAGLFLDWDLPGEASRNAAEWDAARQLGYCYDVGAPHQYAGVRLLRGGPPITYAINNNAPAGAAVRFADGFSRAEKYLTLSSGAAEATRTAGLPAGADVSQVVGANLGAVAAGDSVTLVLAVLAAETLPQLQAAADAAQAAYAQVLPTQTTTLVAGFEVYPNPTTGSLHLEIPPSFGAKQVQLLDALGRVVLRRPVPQPAFELLLTGLPPGAYSVRVISAEGRALSRLVLLR